MQCTARARQVGQTQVDLAAEPVLSVVPPAQPQHDLDPVRLGPRHQGQVDAHRVFARCQVDNRFAHHRVQIPGHETVMSRAQIRLTERRSRPQPRGAQGEVGSAAGGERGGHRTQVGGDTGKEDRRQVDRAARPVEDGLAQRPARPER